MSRNKNLEKKNLVEILLYILGIAVLAIAITLWNYGLENRVKSYSYDLKAEEPASPQERYDRKIYYELTFAEVRARERAEREAPTDFSGRDYARLGRKHIEEMVRLYPILNRKYLDQAHIGIQKKYKISSGYMYKLMAKGFTKDWPRYK